MERREFITGVAGALAVTALPLSAVAAMEYHPVYLRIAKQLGFTSSEMGDKMGVLIARDGVDKAWTPIRFDDLHKGDIIRIVNPYDGPVEGNYGCTGEWLVEGTPYLAPNELGRQVMTVVTEEIKPCGA